MNNEIYGLKKDPWPFEYVVSALQLLALPEKDFNDFVPKIIEETIYDGGGGCVISNDPLVITFSFLLDYISPGITWDEWIDDPQLENIGLDSIFVKLYENFVHVHDYERDSIRRKELLNQCRNLSKKILLKVGLYRKHELPFFSWRELVQG